MTQISVIIPCYNQRNYISECLDSVLAQTYTDYEVIIVNDGSTDDSVSVISPYLQKHKNIKLINQKNQGVVAARNNAIRQAQGQYIYPLDADDKIEKTMFEKSIKAIEQGKGDIITTRVYMFGQKEGYKYLPKPSRTNMSCFNCLVNAALFRKSDFDKTTGYDEKFNLGIEDYDLWLNMVFCHNLKIYRIPEVLFFYRIKTTDESRNQKLREYFPYFQNVFKTKYPQMKHYKRLAKLQRIFFRVSSKDNCITYKVLGITIYKKYY